MKAITVWQPWASLIAVGAKRIETRGWVPPATIVGTRVAIHAAKRPPPPLTDRVVYALEGHALPLGVIVCTVVIERIELITRELVADLTRDEYEFGDYSPGRVAWMLAYVERTPWVEVRGAQGFFDVDDPFEAALGAPGAPLPPPRREVD